MNKENELKLLTTFPILYSNFSYNSRRENKIQFEFRCRNGWFNIVWEMSKKLDIETKNFENFHIVQLKEKFGQLRVYTSEYTKNIEGIISEAWNRSVVTCEVCGKMGRLRDQRRWQFTLCDEHKDQWYRKGAGF